MADLVTTICRVVGGECRIHFKEELERVAVLRLVEWLRTARCRVDFVCTPEKLRPCTWNMDAVLAIDGETWIIDHTLLTWNEKTRPWIDEADRELRQRLDPQAEKGGYAIALECPPVVGSKRQRAAIYASIDDFVREAAATLPESPQEPSPWIRRSDELAVQFLPGGQGTPNECRVSLLFSLADDHDLVGQFTQVNWPTNRKKVISQLAPIDDHYDKAGLLLDQSTVLLPLPLVNVILTASAIKTALTNLMATVESPLDRIWLVTPDAEITEVWRRG